MVLLKNTTLNLIDSYDITDEKPRPYLGMSSIGEECERKIWYNFHWCVNKKYSQRVFRIFNTGHIAEKFIISDLKRIGIKCFYRFDNEIVDMTGEIGEKQESFEDISGHFRGHCDGRVVGILEDPETEHILEMKTHNDKSFKDVVKNGVKTSKPTHYAQMQIYMHYAKLNRSLYIAYNKNDSNYYFERISYDKDKALDLKRKAFDILMSKEPPTKKFSKTWYACKWCDFRDICHNNDSVEKNCRTCKKSVICDNGKWECSKNNQEINYDEQLTGCDKYEIGWGL